MAEVLQLRVHHPAVVPTLIYLPGLHGDWTLIGRFRDALGARARLVEITYPRTLDWSLEDYGRAVVEALQLHGIHQGWLLGESFSSSVVWPIVGEKRFKVEGVILAGGFVRHPVIWAVRMAEKLAGSIPLGIIIRILFGYARISRFRHRKSPDTLRTIDEFLQRRTPLDQKAATHRLHLLARNDPCEIARQAGVPIYALTGFFDPIVPWYWVRGWLKANCRTLKEFRVIRNSDHNVLSNASKVSADQIATWMSA